MLNLSIFPLKYARFQYPHSKKEKKGGIFGGPFWKKMKVKLYLSYKL